MERFQLTTWSHLMGRALGSRLLPQGFPRSRDNISWNTASLGRLLEAENMLICSCFIINMSNRFFYR